MCVCVFVCGDCDVVLFEMCVEDVKKMFVVVMLVFVMMFVVGVVYVVVDLVVSVFVVYGYYLGFVLVVGVLMMEKWMVKVGMSEAEE